MKHGMKTKKIILVILSVVIVGMSIFFVWQKMHSAPAQVQDHIEEVIRLRKEVLTEEETHDPFGEDDRARVLLIGLDKRIGETLGHCDAIQMIDIDRKKQTISITAVPRGTYSPLPRGVYAETDYYISNACGVAGLEYGIDQIEKILRMEADYVIIVGFSQTLGILRYLGLPPQETLQWLRHRQGYQIGEPQRARNHSNFIKKLIVDYLPRTNQQMGDGLKRLIYSFVDTDLTFAQSQELVHVLEGFDLNNRPQAVTLHMKPYHEVVDFEFDPEAIDEHLSRFLLPVADRISEGAYQGVTYEEAQEKVRILISENLQDEEFVRWAYQEYVWLQLDDPIERENAHFEVMRAYALFEEDEVVREEIVADYIIEKEHMGLEDYAQRARGLIQ